MAGRNVRYNNIQIDGAVNNDVFSIASGAGTPGGAVETQPISFDVIQELQLVVSPYDVRQGMFSGGGINAITKSGTNELHGSTFYVFRDQRLVGDGIDKRPIATFNDKQFGGTVGGPLVRNRAFFLGNAEWGRKNTPSGYSVSGTSGVTFALPGRSAAHSRHRHARGTATTRGASTSSSGTRTTTRCLSRTDFNLGSDQLTVRHNYVDGFNDVGSQSNTTYKFPATSTGRTARPTRRSASSTRGSASAVNEFRVTYQRIRDFRTFANRFPFVVVRLPDGSRFNLGTENSSHANELDQDIVEVHDDYTMVRGSHTYTFGTHNEFFKFRNLFIQNMFGNYDFASIDNFAAGIAQGFDHSFSLTSDPQQAARFKVCQFGVYAGDQWRVRPTFTLTYGIRWDKPHFPDTPTANPAAVASYGFRTDVVPSPQQWSPRAGFNWDLTRGNVRQQVRGGVGLFGGRNPFVYLSNQYGNTGIEFRRISLTFNAANSVPFSADPDNQPKAVGNAGTNEIDVVDPDYQFPSIVRGNLAYDREPPVRAGRRRRAALHEHGAGPHLPEPEPGADRHPSGWPAVLRPRQPDVQRRHPAPQHRRGPELDGHDAARAPLQRRLVRARRLLVRSIRLGQRHDQQHGAIDVDQRLHAWRHQQPAGGRLELRRPPSRRAERLLPAGPAARRT